MSSIHERAVRAKKVAKKINRIRKTGPQMSMWEIASLLDVHPKTVSGWATGRWGPKTDELYERVNQTLDMILSDYYVNVADQPVVQIPLSFGNVTHAPSALDTQIGGNHYKNNKIQPVQYSEANNLPFLEGSVVKRITRHDKPTGKGVEDLRKIIHEVELILELRYGVKPTGTHIL
jgi:hypothetical protein